MITLFVGDSFTWGQGLQYYSLMENHGWSYSDCNRFYKSLPEIRFESLGFDVDEFRKQNGFPALVSKHINLSFSILNLENGGDNKSIYDAVRLVYPTYITSNNISMVIIQFSNPARSVSQNIEVIRDTMEEQITDQITRIATILNSSKINWLALSWEEMMGTKLKELYPDNHIPILYENCTYDSFDLILGEINIEKETNGKIVDEHLSITGHKVIANSIISKIYSRKDLVHQLNLGGTYD
jgi:hypothetical protein